MQFRPLSLDALLKFTSFANEGEENEQYIGESERINFASLSSVSPSLPPSLRAEEIPAV